MGPKWPKLASLALKICTLWFQLFNAFFTSKGYPFKNIFDLDGTLAQGVALHFQVTLTLTYPSDLISRITMSVAYLHVKKHASNNFVLTGTLDPWVGSKGQTFFFSEM